MRLKSDCTRADLREDISSRYPQNIYKAVFGVREATDVQEIAGLAGDRGALEFAMLLAGLSDREADILRLRFQKNKTLEAVTEVYGINRERVRQIEAKALRKMRRPCVCKLLTMGLRAWMEEQIHIEARSIADLEVPQKVHEMLTERLEWAQQHMQEREEEIYRLARDGETQSEQDVKAILAENITLEELELSVRAYNCMKRAGCNTVADIIKMTEKEMMCIRNLGRKSMEEVIAKVRERGFELRQEVG